MGQSGSSLEALSDSESSFRASSLLPPLGVSRRVHRLRRVANLSRVQLVDLVSQINELADACLDDNGQQIHFELLDPKQSGSVIESSAFWRARSGVQCVKVDIKKGLRSCKHINLADFVAAADHLLAVRQGIDNDDLAKAVHKEQHEEHKEESKSEENECCICLERRHELVLNCGHVYCVWCIDRWHVDHETCPVCRRRSTHNEGWIVSSTPEVSDVVTDIQKALMSLAADEA